MLDKAEMESLIREVFRRISSGGQESLEPLLADSIHLEGAYSPHYFLGKFVVAKLFTDAFPQILNPFEQWPTEIYPIVEDQVVLVEYESRGRAVHDGSTYENRYAGVLKLDDGKISFWREYFDPRPFLAAVGSDYATKLEHCLPPGGKRQKA